MHLTSDWITSKNATVYPAIYLHPLKILDPLIIVCIPRKNNWMIFIFVSILLHLLKQIPNKVINYQSAMQQNAKNKYGSVVTVQCPANVYVWRCVDRSHFLGYVSILHSKVQKHSGVLAFLSTFSLNFATLYLHNLVIVIASTSVPLVAVTPMRLEPVTQSWTLPLNHCAPISNISYHIQNITFIKP